MSALTGSAAVAPRAGGAGPAPVGRSPVIALARRRSALATCPGPAPVRAAVQDDVADDEVESVDVADDGPADDGVPPGRPGAYARLAPRVEPPAQALPAVGPPHARPPVLGSPEALRRARPVPSPADASLPAPGSPGGPLPDPTPLCCAMAQAAVEGLRGARPLAQLVRWVSPDVYDRLVLRAQLVQGSRAPAPATGRSGVRRIRVFRIGDGAAEASVVVDDGARVRAVAVRLEAHRGRWRATALEIG